MDYNNLNDKSMTRIFLIISIIGISQL